MLFPNTRVAPNHPDLSQKAPTWRTDNKIREIQFVHYKRGEFAPHCLMTQGHTKAQRLAVISVDVVFLEVLNLGGSGQVRLFLSSPSSYPFVPAVKN